MSMKSMLILAYGVVSIWRVFRAQDIEDYLSVLVLFVLFSLVV